MNTTELEEVYSFFFSKITTYGEFVNLEKHEIEAELMMLLRSSLSRIFEFDDIQLDVSEGCFNRNLDDVEKEILGLGMVCIWIEQKVNNVENFERFLGSKDYTFYSQANHLKELISAKDSVSVDFRYLIKRYSTRKFINKTGVS